MDDLLKAAIKAVKEEELAKRTTPAGEAAPTPGDAMDPAAGANVSTSEGGEGIGIGDMLSGLGDTLGGVASAGMETVGRLVRGEADPEFAEAVTGAETELDNTEVDPNAEPGLHEKTVATMAAIPTGAVKAGYEAVDGAKSLLGVEPGPKSPERTKVEALDEALRSRTMAAGLASSLSSFTVGLIGAGKLLGPLKALAGGSKLAKGAYEVAKGATAGFFALDPHETRLSDIVQAFPSLENPVTAYLASNPEDTQIEGRLNNALEGVGMDVAAASLFAVGLKALKALRSGDQEAAKAAATELDTVAKEVEVPPPAKPVSDDDVMAAIEGHPERPVEEAVDVLRSVVQADIPAPQPSTVAEQTATPVSRAVTPSTVENIIAGTKADLKAVDEAGGVAAAINAGYRLEATTSFPWKRVVTGDDVDVLVENSLKQVRPELNAMKGGDVLHDVDVAASLKDIAKSYQADPQLILGELSQAGDAAVDSVRRMEAGHLIFRKMSLDVTAAVKKFNAGQFAEFGGEEAAREEIKRRIGLMLEVYGQTQAIVSNAGRVIRRQRAEFDSYGAVLQEMGRVDDRQLFRTIEQMDGNPELIKQAIKPGFWRRVLEEATFSMRNGLLWLYPSHAFNIAGNVLIAAARPMETAIGSIFLGRAGSPLMKRVLREYVYTGASVWDGFKAAADTFLEADSRLAPHSTDLINGAETSTHLHDLRDFEWQPVADAGDVWANAHAAFNYLYRNGTGLPSRLMGAQDSFFKTLRYRSLVQAEAHVEGVSQGLSGQGLKDYVASRLEAAFDETGKATNAKALREAQIVTLNQDFLPKTLGASISNARGVHPWLGLILPYVKTPVKPSDTRRNTHRLSTFSRRNTSMPSQAKQERRSRPAPLARCHLGSCSWGPPHCWQLKARSPGEAPKIRSSLSNSQSRAGSHTPT
jgi:hypothetical protein